MFDKLLFDKLACPKCGFEVLNLEISNGSEFDVKQGQVSCSSCHSHYPIEDGIAMLLPDFLAPDLEARAKSWKTWGIKMRNFMEWRKKTWNGSEKANEFQQRVDTLNKGFFDFCALPKEASSILDVGCGGGTFGQYLESQHLYIGIDPLLVPGETQKFRIVQGVAERLPFKDRGFRYAIVMATLDHVREPEVVLREVHRVLDSNGYLCLLQTVQPEGSKESTDASLFKRFSALFGRAREVDWEDTHIHDFSESNLYSLLNKKFSVEKHRIVQTEDCVCLFAKCLKKAGKD